MDVVRLPCMLGTPRRRYDAPVAPGRPVHRLGVAVGVAVRDRELLGVADNDCDAVAVRDRVALEDRLADAVAELDPPAVRLADGVDVDDTDVDAVTLALADDSDHVTFALA